MKKEISLIDDMGYLMLKIAILAGILILVGIFVFGVFRNEGIDMAPAVKDGDLVIFYRLDKRYTASDVIVLEWKGEKQVRRVVAVAGDTVDITEDGLMINSALQQEAGIYEETQRYVEGIEFPVTVKEGQVFVLGDGRESSTDSRIYGPVEVKDTMGKVMFLVRRRGI